MLAELEKLEANLGGVADMRRQPDAVFIVDLKKEQLAVREARRLGLPIIALVDTNCDPDEADYVIPGNDDAIRSCSLIVRAIAEGVAAGQTRVTEAELSAAPNGSARRRAEPNAARRSRCRRGCAAPEPPSRRDARRARAAERSGETTVEPGRVTGAAEPASRVADEPATSAPRRPLRPKGRRPSEHEISASLVKELRDATGAGMMECKRALQETDGDLEAARTLLRERGMALAGKRAGRATSEGLVGYHQSPRAGSRWSRSAARPSRSRRTTSSRRSRRRCSTPSTPTGPRRSRSSSRSASSSSPSSARTSSSPAPSATRPSEPARRSAPTCIRRRTSSACSSSSPAARPSSRGSSRCTSRSAARNGSSKEDVPDGRRRGRAADPAQLRRAQSASRSRRKEKIVEGMLAKRFFAAQPGGALTEQPWIHDSAKTVGQALGEAEARVLAFKLLAVAE